MAIIGTVIYPTETTWEVEVTDLATGTNTFTVSDGTDVVQVVIDMADPVVASGAASGSAGATASLTQRRPLAGVAAGRSTTTGGNPADVRAAASAGGQAGASATLASQPPIGGSAGGFGGAVATLRAIAPVPYAVLTATSDDGEEVAFGVRGWTLDAEDGTSIGVGIAPTGYYGPGVELSGAAAGHAGATAAPGVLQQLAGAAAGHADGRASTGDVSGVAGGHADASGSLRQAQALAGTADGHAGASATGLQLPTPLAGTASGRADATGDIKRVPLSAAASGDAEATGTLTQHQPLAGVAAGRSEATAAPVQPVADYSILGAKPIRWGLLAKSVPHGHRPQPIRLGLKPWRSTR